MKTIPEELFHKVKKLGEEVKERLKKKGIAVPRKIDRGLIRVGYFKIKKNSDGFYSILDHADEVVYGQINLPQTAVVVANQLAVGRWADSQILNADKKYGHALFEEELQRKLAARSLKLNKIDQAELMLIKLKNSKLKKEQYKKSVLGDFEKLMRIR